MSGKIKPVSPGEMLAEESLSGGAWAIIGWRMGSVCPPGASARLAGKRAITAARISGCAASSGSRTPGARLQADHDTEVAKASLAKIRPWKEAAEQTVDAY